MTRKLFVLNGPNLNMLGHREPELYGTTTIDDIRDSCARLAAEAGFELFFGQSNAESQLIDWLHDAYREDAAVVINPAGLSFRSIPLLDALLMLRTPIVEIHLTNIHRRDALHQDSLVSTVATSVIAGAGAFGYELAIRAIDQLVPRASEAA
ncbi:type II 3-dehydroquinate dehydratase [Agromyces seonyuensis]|uniref:3-dehydroquinate dehydratase n=1 Tax=Agromyces seonyuensis TaxID=2662446 RepID=A0A6I4NVS4_9MICO|nr:type II 3-dehydroquinate dehydratase [Agromyces seonyuensis]